MTALAVRTRSVEETRELGAALAGMLEAGDVLVLSGEMGAGKTAFTQGLGRGLGVTGRITSPTFTIVQTYEEGRLCLHHLDVYRLEHLNDALDVGLGEMLDDAAVVVVEWGDAVAPVLPSEHLELRITFGLVSPETAADPAAADLRHWAIEPRGVRWAARTRILGECLAPWRDDAC